MEKKKQLNKAATSNYKKESQSKPKQSSNKSAERRKIGINITTEFGLNNSNIEVKSEKDKIHLTKPRKEKTSSQKTISSRSVKTNKNKEYENTLNKLIEDEIEKDKEYDFFNFKINDVLTKKKEEKKEKEKEKNKKTTNNIDEEKKKKKKKVTYKDEKKDKKKEKNKDKNYEDNNNNYEDNSDKEEKDDFIHRAIYRTNVENKINDEKNKNSNDKNKEKKNKEQLNLNYQTQPNNHKFAISMEKTDDIRYNILDKKIYSNFNNKQKNYKTETNNDRINKYEKRNVNIDKMGDKFKELINERTIDLFVIDGDDDDIVVSTKNKKKIDRKRNKFKEIYIEKYDSATPIRNEKLTGFVLIRKNKGKKEYDLHLEDDIDKINSIFKNKEVMIKNDIIQIVPLKKLAYYKNELKNYDDKIYKLQNDLNKKESNKEKEKDTDKENENENLKESVSILIEKNEELTDLLKDKDKQINQNEKELKQIKSSYEKLKESYQLLEKEKKALADQVESYKIKKKVVQFQIDENNSQNIKEMKKRIKKYKDELRKAPPPEARHRLSFTKTYDPDMLTKEMEKQNKKAKVEEDEDGMGVEGGDPKAKKMKNAVNRFKKKYHDVIKEEKKNAKIKEKEEKERQENEEKELEDDNNKEEYIIKQKEEIIQREREEKERREREERERKEREKRETEERERKERERKVKEERERKERERKEKEKREREEKERKERERKEKEKRERDKKEKERKERERKEREDKERERKEKEKRDKEEKDKKEKDKKDKSTMGGAKAAPKKMMGGNFAKMLADKLKMPPGGGMGMKKNDGGRNSVSKPPIVEKNVNVVQLLEEQPFNVKKIKKKPTKKVFVVEEDD